MLILRSREVSKPRDRQFKSSYSCEIWQARRQQCCRGACQISQRSDYSKYKSRGIETSRDLTIRRLIGYWNGALVPTMCRSLILLMRTWSLQWRHNDHDGVSNHQPHGCLFNQVYSGTDRRKHQSSASRAFACGEFTGSGEFPAQTASNAENVSIWWRHRGILGSGSTHETLSPGNNHVWPLCIPPSCWYHRKLNCWTILSAVMLMKISNTLKWGMRRLLHLPAISNMAAWLTFGNERNFENKCLANLGKYMKFCRNNALNVSEICVANGWKLGWGASSPRHIAEISINYCVWGSFGQ